MDIHPISKKSIIVWRIQYSVIFILLTVIINILGPLNIFIYDIASILNLVIYFSVIVIFIPLEYKNTKFLISDIYIKINKGVIIQKNISINIEQIQHIKVSQTLIQRFARVCTITFFTSGNKIQLSQIELNSADCIKNRLYWSKSDEKNTDSSIYNS